MTTLSRSKVNAYAFYAFASSVAFAVPMGYLTVFMTENLLFSAALMGSTLLIARFIDFIIGFIAGGIVQKTSFKWGKYRSWLIILRFAVFTGITLQFVDTSKYSTGVKMLITILGYGLLHFSMNFIQTAQYGVMSAMAGSDMDDRNKLAIRSTQWMAAANILMSAITIPFIQFISPYVGKSRAYTVAAALFAAVYVVGNIILSRAAAPYDLPTPKGEVSHLQSVTIGDIVKSIFTNSQLLVYILASSLYNIGVMATMGLAAYYFLYVLGNFLLMSVAMTATTIFGLAASYIGPKIGTKLGKKKAMVIGLLFYAASSICISLFAKSSLVIYIVFGCTGSLAMYMFQGFGGNYVLDAGEYGYYKTGKDMRAVATGLFTIPFKVGFALGGAISGYGLAIIGYTAGMTATPEFINNFMWLLGIVPAICYILSALLMQFGYKITDENAAKYVTANAQRSSNLTM